MNKKFKKITKTGADGLMAKLREFCQSYGIIYCALFGSRARGEALKKSDLDLIVEFNRPIGGFEYIRLQQELEARTGLEVDMLTKEGLRLSKGKSADYFKSLILKDLKVVYEEK